MKKLLLALAAISCSTSVFALQDYRIQIDNQSDYKVVFDYYTNPGDYRGYSSNRFLHPYADNGNSRIIMPYQKVVDITGIRNDSNGGPLLHQTFYKIRLRDTTKDYSDGTEHYDAYREILIGLSDFVTSNQFGDLVGYSVGGTIN